MFTINVKALRDNMRTIRANAGGAKICAVLKSNAYGMGDTFVADAIQDQADMFAVARLSEAIRLRDHGITKPILLLGVCGDFELSAKLNITVSVHDVAQMMDLVRTATAPIAVHITVDTGMNRFGIRHPWQLKTMLDIARRNGNIKIDGLYTHFTHEDNTTTGQRHIDKQLFRFVPFRAIMRRAHPRAIVHAAYSGALGYGPAQFDMVRPGKAIFGGYQGYKTAVKIHAKIVATKHIGPGDTVGYGGRFVATSRMTIGVVNCGYATAGFLALGHATHLVVGKKRCRILGSVCMDTMFIDVSDIRDPVGRTVIITDDKPGARITDFIKQSGRTGALYLCSLK